MTSINAFTRSALAAGMLVMAASGISAQMISFGSNGTATSSDVTFALDTYGPTDWVQFGVNGTETSFDATNEKSGGSLLDTVGAVSVSGDGADPEGRTQNTSNLHASYSNGAAPASSTTSVSGSAAGTWSIQTNYGNNGDVSDNVGEDPTLAFTITFNQAISSGDIYLGANTYQAVGTLTAALSNGNSISAGHAYVNGNYNDIFDIAVQNVTAGSTLSLTWSSPYDAAANPLFSPDNISLTGVALDLTEAPEGSTYAMFVVGCALLGLGLRGNRARA